MLGYAACVHPCWVDMQASPHGMLAVLNQACRRNVFSSKNKRKPMIRAGLFRTMLWYLISQQCLFCCHEKVDAFDNIVSNPFSSRADGAQGFMLMLFATCFVPDQK